MFDWVPIQNYPAYFDIAILLCILLVLWQCHAGSVLKKDVAALNGVWGLLFTIFLILYMGLRPVNAIFGDTVNYANEFTKYAHNHKDFVWVWETEWLYYNLLHWFSKNWTLTALFLLSAFFYIGNLWLACVRIFKNYYYIPLLVVFCMFTFWQYGVNGIRNGLGASFFILAMTYTRNLPIMGALILIGIGCHTSVCLMAAAAFLAWHIKNSYYYLIGWIASVGLSYAIGGRIQTYLSTFGIFGADERFSAYLTGSNQVGEIVQLAMTFRWDFLIYSALGVAVGYYFIFRRHYKDEYYHWIYNTYLATNAFWVLIIRANYSNRFAQISWFILPLVLIYPFLRKRFWQNQEKVLAGAILVFYAYGFYTNIIQPNVFTRIFF